MHTQKVIQPVIAVFSVHKNEHPFLSSLSQQDRAYVISALASFKGERFEIERLTLPSKHSSCVLLMGLGDKDTWSARHMALATRKLVQYVKGLKWKHVSLLLDDMKVSGISLEQCAESMAQNAELAHYAFTTFREEPKGGWPQIEAINYYVRGVAAPSGIQKALDRGACIGEQINTARELANTPGGDMTPKRLGKAAVEYGKHYGFSVKVLGEAEMKKLKMGALLGVSRGSSEEAQLIVMEYMQGAKSKRPFVFIGKGITYDSGGLNLKPTGALDEMHMDMSGGAAVIAAVTAIARMKMKVNVVGIVPAVENMPSGSSYRPGDVLKSMSGKTIEIVNTDAEGRVVLADALTYAKKYNPSLVVDLATLTGACMVALAPYAAGLFSRDEKIISQLRIFGERSGDYLWPLPMWEEYEEELKGKVGDIKNAKQNRDAGATNGALFLHQFAKDFARWAHIDIAPTMTSVPGQFLSPGARGCGTALLIEIARNENNIFRS